MRNRLLSHPTYSYFLSTEYRGTSTSRYIKDGRQYGIKEQQGTQAHMVGNYDNCIYVK